MLKNKWLAQHLGGKKGEVFGTKYIITLGDMFSVVFKYEVPEASRKEGGGEVVPQSLHS